MTTTKEISKKNLLPVKIKSADLHKHILNYLDLLNFECFTEFNEQQNIFVIYIDRSINDSEMKKLKNELDKFPKKYYNLDTNDPNMMVQYIDSYDLSLNEKYSLLSLNGRRLVTHHGVYSLYITENQLIIKKILNRKNAVICSISPNGNHIILKEKRSYVLYEVNLNYEIELSQLSSSKNYYFIFSRNSNYFASVDEDGEFIYHNISGQGLIKFEIEIESYLSLKTLSSKKFLTTEESIYDFSGNKIATSDEKHIYHFYDSEYLIRENLSNFQLEVIINQEIRYRTSIQNHRFIHQIEFLNNRYLIINLDDEELEFHDIVKEQSVKIKPENKIKSTAIYQDEFFLVLLENNDILLYKILNTF